MPRYKFEIKVRENFTAFDYKDELHITTRHKTVVAPTLADARDKIQTYVRQFGVVTYTARLIKSTVKEDNLATYPLRVDFHT
jgi:hypothetical protein